MNQLNLMTNTKRCSNRRLKLITNKKRVLENVGGDKNRHFVYLQQFLKQSKTFLINVME